MASSAWREKLVWVPVGLLIGVALTHVIRVELFELTPWKGGGFGMFSTLDGVDNRHLIVNLVTGHGETARKVLIDLPRTGSLRNLAQKAKAMPTEARVRAFALEVAKQPWRVALSKTADGSNNARLVRNPARLASTRLVAFDGVEVIVWKLLVQNEGRTIAADPELIRTTYVEGTRARGRR
jgi:hypothetical protein